MTGKIIHAIQKTNNKCASFNRAITERQVLNQSNLYIQSYLPPHAEFKFLPIATKYVCHVHLNLAYTVGIDYRERG